MGGLYSGWGIAATGHGCRRGDKTSRVTEGHNFRTEVRWSQWPPAGKRTGVKVTPHMLRHTFATQLVNAGCRITSIQKLMGHRHLEATMVYARVHDRTVAVDYYAAMAIIEKQMDFNSTQAVGRQNGNGSACLDLLALVDALRVDEDQRALVAEIRRGLLTITLTG